MSMIFLILNMNLLVKSAEFECRGPLMRNGVWQTLIRAYMDDVTVTLSSVAGCQSILQDLEKIIT